MKTINFVQQGQKATNSLTADNAARKKYFNWIYFELLLSKYS